LGHVISKDGISMDPERKKTILQIPPPRSKKSMQTFFGRINFVVRFVPSFVDIVKQLQRMIKKDMSILNGQQWRKKNSRISNLP
jgi:hypothetical protein